MATAVMTAKHYTHVTRPWSTCRALVSFVRYLLWPRLLSVASTGGQLLSILSAGTTLERFALQEIIHM